MQALPDQFIAPPCDEQIDILYQDESILLINKPSKLLSLSGKNPLNKDSVHYRLVQDFPTALMVHRLDLGTSGIMVVGLNKTVTAQMCRQFSERNCKKTYSAILYGQVKEDVGTLRYPIAKGKFPLQQICTETGKPAQSDYQVVKRLPHTTEVTFTPVTGRTHQLRIHAREMGHPILGCDLYKNSESQAMATRLMLHATTLEFNHPVTGKPMKGVCHSPFSELMDDGSKSDRLFSKA